MTIYKYPLPRLLSFTLPLPADARVLSVQVQDHTSVMWCMLDPEAEEVSRRFHVVGTGWPIDRDMANRLSFIDTFQDGDLVWHVFEEIP